MKRTGLFILTAALALSLCGCGNSSNAYDSKLSLATETQEYALDYSDGYYSNGEITEASAATAGTESSNILEDSSRKLIKTYNLDLETENFDSLLTSIEARVNSLGGYIESLDTYNGSTYYSRDNSYSNLTVRIPDDKLEEFVKFVGEAANITNESLNVEDVTLQYVDVESKKKALETEEDRLLELLEKCETVEDMIKIEERLADVRYELETEESQLRIYDNLVDYSTVYLYINEVTKYSEPAPVSFGERIKEAFADGCESVWDGLKEFAIDFVGALPGIVLFVIIVIIVVVIIKAVHKKSKAKKQIKDDKRAEELMGEAKETAKEKALKNGK